MKYKLIGKKIKIARREKGLTQEELAEELDVSVSFISQVETGKKRFNLSRISEISEILEKPVGYFIDGYEGINSDKEEIICLLKKMDEKQLKMVLEIVRILERAG